LSARREQRELERKALALFTSDAAASPENGSQTGHPRRVVAGWVFLAVALVLAVVLSLLPAPYVIEQPGPVFNTLGTNQAVGAAKSGHAVPLITIPGKKTYPTSGSLDMLTVSVVGNPQQLPTWLQVATAWFDPTKAVSPVQELFPAGLTSEQSNKQNQVLMVDSQKDAVAAALNELGYRFPQRIKVLQVVKGAPADGVLRVGDQIVSLDGTPVHGIASLQAAVGRNGTRKRASVGIERDGHAETVQITPVASGGSAVLGIGVGMDYTFPFAVDIQLNNVGGPSAGQMFALGIIDKLTPGSLNGGARVAGTGTIDNEGNIGAIGGIRQKMYGARDAGATYFLAPKSNCDEVTGHIPSGLRVFAVTTLGQSLAVLKAVRTHGDLSHLPSCPAG
jgi:PDZ domain-containing protein